jgi:hypothetical protein
MANPAASFGATSAASGAAMAAAIANAIKASGAIVRLAPPDFETIVNRTRDPLVVVAEGGFLTKNHQYLTSYKGLFFFCKSPTPVQLPSDVEVIRSKNIWIPG